jgi:hypothetical protein
MPSVTYRIAQTQDTDPVYQYEYNKNFSPDESEIENQIRVWDSFFRKESIEHYFKTGWSFVAIDQQEKICGFFLAQPLLFLDRQTQTLWVEYISADSDEIFYQLVDIAYRLSREKHFQRVIFAAEIESKLVQKLPFQIWERQFKLLKTTK